MPFRTTSVSSVDIEKARSGTSYKQYVVMNPNDVVISARVNQTKFKDILGEVTLDDITGTTSSALPGFIVLFSRTASQESAYLRTRVRKAISGATLYINATSANIQDDDWVWVIRDVPLLPKYPYVVGDTVKFDFDLSFEQIPPFVGAGAGNEDSIPKQAYVSQLSNGTTTVTFSTHVIVATSGATLSSVSLSDGNGNTTSPTITSLGNNEYSLSDSDLTYTSEGVYWLRLTMTDSNGSVGFYTCPVFIISEDINASSLDLIEIETSRFSYELGRGGTCEITTKYSPSQWAYQQLACVFDLNDNETEDNVKFVGRIVPERNSVITKEKNGYVKSSGITLESTVQYITRVGMGTIAMVQPDGTPTQYGEVTDLTIWRAFALLATQLSSLANITPIAMFDTADDYRIDSFGTVKQSAYDTFESLQFAVNAWMNERPEGGIHFARSGQYLSDNERSSLPVIFDIETQDIVSIDEITKEHPQQVGRMVAYGGSYQTESDGVLVLLSYCPAKVPTEAPQQNEYNRQVLKSNLDFAESSEELSIRCQTQFAENNPFWRIGFRTTGSYDWFCPHGSHRYTITLPSTYTVSQRVFTSNTYWYIQNVEITYKKSTRFGAIKEFSVRMSEELKRGIYQTFEEQAPGLGNFDPGDLNPGDFGFSVDPVDYLDLEGLGLPPPNTPLPLLPNEPQEDPTTVAPGDAGPPTVSSVFSSTIVSVSRTSNRLLITNDLAKPSYGITQDISPGEGETVDFCFDFYGTGIYALTYNSSTDKSLIHYKPTVRGFGWKNTAQLDGLWNRIKVGDQAGIIHIFMLNSQGETQRQAITVNFESGGYQNFAGSGGWIGTPPTLTTTGFGYNSANAWRAVQNFGGLQPGSNWADYGTVVTFDQVYSVYGIEADVWLLHENADANSGDIRFRAYIRNSSNTVLSTKLAVTYDITSNGWVQLKDRNFTAVANASNIFFAVGVRSNSFGGGNAEARLDNLIIYLEEGFDSKYAYSDNYGPNFTVHLLGKGSGRPANKIGSSVNYDNNTAYMSTDDEILSSTGGTPVSYASVDAVAIWATVTTQEVWYATETTLYKDGFNRTPNDGINNGVAISEHSIAIPRSKENTIYFLGDFGGTIKLARSGNSGNLWGVFTNISALTSNNPKGVFVNPANWVQIIITTDGTSVLYSEDGGFTFYTRFPKNTDISNLSFWENNWVI